MRRPAAATVFGCASVLLSYPDGDLGDDLKAVAHGLATLPAGSARSRLESVAGWLGRLSPTAAATAYVDTFDLRRGTSLHLTYYRHGDTRERGMALTALIDTYRSAGFRIVPGELPDFLPALLELAATHPAGGTVLAEHRMALDALRLALDKADSPYADVVAAVGDALPRPSQADRDALRRYRAQGPPSERVGLEPFAPPEVVAQGLAMGPTRR
ncbi:MAG: nitrate reductase molybdenum cofactor assembly chaperone [Acidimicrobiales bacterium]